MPLQFSRCLLASLLLLSLKGIGNALSVDEENNDGNSAGKRKIFFDINSLPPELSPDPLKSVGVTQKFAIRGKIYFPSGKLTSKSVMDGQTYKVTLQKNQEHTSQKPLFGVSSARNLVSWLGMKMRMMLRYLIQPIVEKYFSLAGKLPIESSLPMVKDEPNNSQFKSNKLSRDSAENVVSTIGEELKIKISDLVDNTNEFKSGQKIDTAFRFPEDTTKRRNRRSPNQYLTEDIYLPRRSSELGSDEPNEHLLNSLKSPSILATSAEHHHIDDLFLDENFMRDVSYFVNHPDRMLSADAPGIVGIGKLRPTKPPSTTTSTTTEGSIVKTVGHNKASISDKSKYVVGSSSEEETEITHEYIKTVESHKSTVKTKKKHKNHEQAGNSVDISVESHYINTPPYKKQSKMGRPGVTQLPLTLMTSLSTPEVASSSPSFAGVYDDYANKNTFSTQAYTQSHISTIPRRNNQLLRWRPNHNTTPGTFHEEYTIPVTEKPQQSTLGHMTLVPKDAHKGDYDNYRTTHEYNGNPFSNYNVIDRSNVFYGNDLREAPYSQLQQQLNNLNIYIYSEGEASSGKLKQLVPENAYRLQPPFSNVPTLARAHGTFPEAYDITNSYGPNGERFWNPQTVYRAFNSPALYSYENWRKVRNPEASAL